MTVPSTKNVKTHTGNGVATVFPFDFRIFAASDLDVTLTLDDGTVENWVLDTDYTVADSSINKQSGGEIVATTAPADLSTLVIRRVLPQTQLTDLRNQGAYYAEVVERVFDRLTMLVQQLASDIGRALRKPFGSAYWDAESAPIKNMTTDASPDDTDGANVSWVKSYVLGLITGSTGDASETHKGFVELATQDETNDGNDDLRAVTPLKHDGYHLGLETDAPGGYVVSFYEALAAGGVYVISASKITLSDTADQLSIRFADAPSSDLSDANYSYSVGSSYSSSADNQIYITSQNVRTGLTNHITFSALVTVDSDGRASVHGQIRYIEDGGGTVSFEEFSGAYDGTGITGIRLHGFNARITGKVLLRRIG